MSDVTLSATWPKARITHTCGSCNRNITPGESYRRTCSIFDGRKYTWKDCAHCVSFIAACDLWEWAGDFGLGPDEIECYEPSDIFGARCYVMWRRKWQRTDGTLYPIPAEVKELASV